jgi:adenylosuccinate synthase
MRIRIGRRRWGILDLQLSSQPLLLRGYKRIAVKVLDVYGNESTIVRELQ